MGIYIDNNFFFTKSYKKTQENKTKIGNIRVNDSEDNKPICGLT